MQGSVDPTNSWTLWTIGYTKVRTAQFLKTALPFGCLMVAINSALYLLYASLIRLGIYTCSRRAER